MAAYKVYAEAGICPASMRFFGTLIRDGVPKAQRIKYIRSGQTYSQTWQETIDWAGMKFLENTLCMMGIQKSFQPFVQNTAELLKNAKRKVTATL